uniref:Uncharacterized protein n=1 Tax=Colwellia sp. C1 TaxID=1737566 RepID=A0A168PHB7_9GAMM|nr:hypothetical protein [Colwellia sp. C1]
MNHSKVFSSIRPKAIIEIIFNVFFYQLLDKTDSPESPFPPKNQPSI